MEQAATVAVVPKAGQVVEVAKGLWICRAEAQVMAGWTGNDGPDILAAAINRHVIRARALAESLGASGVGGAAPTWAAAATVLAFGPGGDNHSEGGSS